MEKLKRTEHYFVEVELPPGVYVLHKRITIHEDIGEYGVQCDEPITVWQEVVRHNIIKQGVMAVGEWKHGGYMIPTWWDKLWTKPRKLAVPMARIVTR